MSGKKKAREKRKNKKNNRHPQVAQGYSLLSRLQKQNWVSLLSWCVLVIIIALMIAGPIYAGYFFETRALTMNFIVFFLGLLWWITKLLRKDTSLFYSPLDCFVLALALFYLFSMFNAAHYRNALAEFLKVASYALVYYMVADLCRQKLDDKKVLSFGENEGDLKQFFSRGIKALRVFLPETVEKGRASVVPVILLYALFISAVIVAAGGLLGATGISNREELFVGGRMLTLLGYYNTGASYVMAAYFIAIGLALSINKLFLRPLFLAPSALLIITLFFTYSRGAWLVMPLMALLFLAASPPGNRLRAFLYFSATAAALLPFLIPLTGAFDRGAPLQGWALIMLTALTMVLGGYLAEYLALRSLKTKLALAGLVVLFSLATSIYYVYSELSKPIHLSLPAGASPVERYLEQGVDPLTRGEEHALSLEVLAFDETGDQDDQAEYVWRLQVLAYEQDYQSSVLLDVREGATDGWEKRQFTFLPDKSHERLEIRLYNKYPGTGITIRDSTLQQEKSITRLDFAYHRLLPDTVYRGIFSRAASVDLRFAHFRDAFRIIQDYPIWGVGGGGFNALYRSYQDHSYSTVFAHNHYLEVWVEAGLFGFLAFIALWISFIAAYIMNNFKKSTSYHYRQFWTAVFIPAMALAAHSAMDFNLSFGLVALFLFILFGISSSLDDVQWFKQNRRFEFFLQPLRRHSGAIIFFSIMMLFLFIAFLLNGMILSGRGQAFLQSGNFKQAEDELTQAIRYDPLRAENYYNLSLIYQRRLGGIGQGTDGWHWHDLSERAYQLEPYNPTYNKHYGYVLIMTGEIDQGLEYLENLIDLRPLDESSYRQYADILISTAERFSDGNQQEQAEDYLHRVLELEQLMTGRLGSSEALNYHLGHAHYLLDNCLEAIAYLEAVDEDHDKYESAGLLLKTLKK